MAALARHGILCIDEPDVQVYGTKTSESIQVIEIAAVNDFIIVLLRCVSVSCALYDDVVRGPWLPVLPVPLPRAQICRL